MGRRALAFDLGGTRLKAGCVLLEPSPSVEDVRVYETPSGGVPAILDLLERAGRDLAERADAVGLAVPGLVEDGRVVSLPGKLDGVVGADLPALLRARFSAPAVVVNDAIAYGIGEASARGEARAVVVTIGTGVGVAVVEERRPLGRGPIGGGLMGGAIPIAATEDGPPDGNGRADTIEALCRAQRLLHDCGGAYDDVAGVLRAYAAGEPDAVAGVARYREDLTRAIVALASAHAPDVVVIGGGPFADAASASALLDGVEGAVNARLFGDYRVRVEPARLGDAAALVGLGHLVEATA